MTNKQQKMQTIQRYQQAIEENKQEIKKPRKTKQSNAS